MRNETVERQVMENLHSGFQVVLILLGVIGIIANALSLPAIKLASYMVQREGARYLLLNLATINIITSIMACTYFHMFWKYYLVIYEVIIFTLFMATSLALVAKVIEFYMAVYWPLHTVFNKRAVCVNVVTFSIVSLSFGISLLVIRVMYNKPFEDAKTLEVIIQVAIGFLAAVLFLPMVGLHVPIIIKVCSCRFLSGSGEDLFHSTYSKKALMTSITIVTLYFACWIVPVIFIFVLPHEQLYHLYGHFGPAYLLTYYVCNLLFSFFACVFPIICAVSMERVRGGYMVMFKMVSKKIRQPQYITVTSIEMTEMRTSSV